MSLYPKELFMDQTKVIFELKTKDRNVIHIDLEEAEFLVESTRMGFPNLWPDEAYEEAQLSNPQFKRKLSLDFTEKFIPELTKRFNEEFGQQFTKGSVNDLFFKLSKYKTDLKKNSDVGTSPASSTDLTAATCPTTNTTIS